MHSLWATPGVSGEVPVADADPEGVTPTNLNRGVLFTVSSIGHPKAAEAAHASNRGGLCWVPHQRRFEEVGMAPDLLVSAVDTNRSRGVLQARYPPAIVAGSSRDLRAEVLRTGLPGVGACLRCYNPPEPEIADDALRAKFAAAEEETGVEIATRAGVPVAEARAWARRGKCGEVGDRLLSALRVTGDETAPRFAVGFTSVLAGTLLAVETLRSLSSASAATSQAAASERTTFQFLKPGSVVNGRGPLGRDPNCPACRPGYAGTRLWQRRSNARVVKIA
jgi:hypothetical protein